jgi:hypothetical protein
MISTLVPKSYTPFLLWLHNLNTVIHKNVQSTIFITKTQQDFANFAKPWES